MPAELPILIFLWRVSSASGSDEEEDDSAGEVAAVREGPASRRHEQCPCRIFTHAFLGRLRPHCAGGLTNLEKSTESGFVIT